MKAGIAIVSLAAALFALPVMAQPGPGAGSHLFVPLQPPLLLPPAQIG